MDFFLCSLCLLLLSFSGPASTILDGDVVKRNHLGAAIEADQGLNGSSRVFCDFCWTRGLMRNHNCEEPANIVLVTFNRTTSHGARKNRFVLRP